MTPSLVLALALVSICLPGEQVQAELKHHRNHPSVRRAFRSTIATARPSTVRVLSDGKQVALGAIVHPDGWFVTKASPLKGKITCRLTGDRVYDVHDFTVDHDYDLAWGKLVTSDDVRFQPVVWAKSEPVTVGSWLATVSLSEDPIAIGVVSVAPREIVPRRGFLGVALAQTEAGPKIIEVIEGSAAALAGLQLDDIVTHISGARVHDRGAMVETIRKLRPGARVRLAVQRNQQPLEVKVTLGTPEMNGKRADRFATMNAMGGKLSERRAGFPSALQHDSILKPHQCGGPIVDLDGNVVGINIARAGRTNSYAIPAAVIQKRLAKRIPTDR